jgi:hypothetical protein
LKDVKYCNLLGILLLYLKWFFSGNTIQVVGYKFGSVFAGGFLLWVEQVPERFYLFSNENRKVKKTMLLSLIVYFTNKNSTINYRNERFLDGPECLSASR